jgi:NAD(P)-dependent dehydrogenase (short-subunit alcohol dehydrogenase family)
MGLSGLTGKVAVVAGGATGIGAATATRLAAEGCLVVVGDVAVDTAQRTVGNIVAAGGTATAVGFDLADPDSVAALLETAESTYGGVDAVFAVGADMGAIRADTDIVDIDLDVWDRVMAVNLRGYVATMKHAIPRLLARGGGAIVNMSSAAAFQGEPARPAYATAKAGIGALTRHVASRWAKRASGATPWRPALPPPRQSSPPRSGQNCKPPRSNASVGPASAHPTTSRPWWRSSSRRRASGSTVR